MLRFVDILRVALVAAVVAAEECRSKCGPKSGRFEFEKGVKCTGGFQEGKGEMKVYSGGMKGSFRGEEAKAEAIAGDVAHELREILPEVVVPQVEDLLPSDDVLEAMSYFDDEAVLDDFEDGFEETYEFGGFVRAQWGCKMTVTKKDGKILKETECGFGGRHGKGKRGDDEVLIEEE